MMVRVKNLLAGLVVLICVVGADAQSKKIIAYYPEWAAQRKGYYVKDIETRRAADKLSVLIYAFSEPGPDSTGAIVPKFMNANAAYQKVYPANLSVNGVADDSTQSLRGQFNQLRELKARHPNLKILISIGGWEGSKYFSDAMMTPRSRETFVDAIVDIFIRGNLPVQNGAGGKGAARGLFDGVDIDWEYPTGGGLAGNHSDINDRNNLTSFYALLRRKFDSIDPKLIITAAVPSSREKADHFNIEKDQQFLDWYDLMTYDFVGEWSPTTNHHTNLLISPRDTSSNPLSFDGAVHLFLDTFDVARGKIVPGAAFYGHGWRNVDPANNGLYQYGEDIATADSIANSSNYSFWWSLVAKGYEYHWDTLAMAPWLYSKVDRVFWSFDDAKSIALKSRYVDAYHLGGLMCWEITGDDTSSTLVNAMVTGEMTETFARRTQKGEGAFSIDLNLSGDKSEFVVGDNVIMNAKVEGHQYRVVRVEFFVDDRSIGFDTVPPFDWVWFNASPGKHELKAVATDSDGGSRMSHVIVVSVKSDREEKSPTGVINN